MEARARDRGAARRGRRALFLGINALWFPLVEEPALERRFGDEYRAYAQNVRRWVPGQRPWGDGVSL